MTGKDIKTKATESIFTIIVAVTVSIITVAFKLPDLIADLDKKKAPYEYVDQKYKESIEYVDKQDDKMNKSVNEKLDLIIKILDEKKNK